MCLLNLISDNTQPSWDGWNILNFSVTAAIGVLALIIAAITVFQGLLAAGPGRLKASNLAIGVFSIYSRSRFDRTELALRTTARVPLITWDVVYHRIVRQKFRPNFDPPPDQHHLLNRSNTDASGRITDEYDERTKTYSTTSSEELHQYDSNATWLTLLTTLGLDDPQFFPLVQRVTDYLPADVQAAPAAAELRCLAILAVIADTNATIEPMSNRFIRVSADSSQLVFRDHPILGPVAAYEAYEETALLKVGDSRGLQFGNLFRPMAFQDLDRCLQLASGRLAYADGRIPPSLDGVVDERTFLLLVRDLKNRSGNCNHDICTHAYTDWDESLTQIREQRQAWHYVTDMRKLYMATCLLAADRANICRGFPKKSMLLKEGLEIIVGLCDFWSTEWSAAKTHTLAKILCMTFWNQSTINYNKDILSASWVVDFHGTRSTVLNPFLPTMRSIHRQQFKEDKTIFNVKKIQSFLTRMLEPEIPTDTLTEGYGERKMSPVVLAHLLTCLDGWLLTRGGEAASCDMLRLLYKLGSQSKLLAQTRSDFQNTPFLSALIGAETNVKSLVNGTLEKVTVDGKVQLELEAHELDSLNMPTMLILRGILMAMLLDDGADTSILYQPDFRNSVVRML